MPGALEESLPGEEETRPLSAFAPVVSDVPEVSEVTVVPDNAHDPGHDHGQDQDPRLTPQHRPPSRPSAMPSRRLLLPALPWPKCSADRHTTHSAGNPTGAIDLAA